MGVVSFSIPKKLVLLIKGNAVIDNFVETGTYLGNTTFWAAKYFKNVSTIEISAEISKQTASRPDCPDNIEFIVGDSRDEIPKLVKKLQGRTLFWLDGHWCSNAGGKDHECPLMDELNAISSCENPVILIDDARCFLGPLPPPHNADDWPTIDEVFALCKKVIPNSFTTIIDDVIVCVPEDLKPVIFNYWKATFNDRFSNTAPVEKSFFERGMTKIYHYLKRKFHQSPEEIENRRIAAFKEVNKWLQEKKIRTVLDVGANTGQFARKARILFPDAKIYSFEPIQSVYEKLKQNFAGDMNFKAFNTALGEENGEVTFFQNDYSDSSSCLKMKDTHKEAFPYTIHESAINVRINTLDAVLKVDDLQSPYLVKLDVQGFEEKVINGGQDIIRNAEYIISEVSFVELYENQPLFNVIYSKLTGMGFRYIGNFEQLLSPLNNEILQADALFKKIRE
ncbi:MAG: FkbM family methyltransferase [Tannerella sp.]|jgi:FkbM family methyltransferase|nr:FkbM family methyltransferase [Tannerella sp.]